MKRDPRGAQFCPHCGARSVFHYGYVGYASSGFQCQNCGEQTLHPMTLLEAAAAGFDVVTESDREAVRSEIVAHAAPERKERLEPVEPALPTLTDSIDDYLKARRRSA